MYMLVYVILTPDTFDKKSSKKKNISAKCIALWSKLAHSNLQRAPRAAAHVSV